MVQLGTRNAVFLDLYAINKTMNDWNESAVMQALETIRNRFVAINAKIVQDAKEGRWVECKAGYRELYERYR